MPCFSAAVVERRAGRQLVVQRVARSGSWLAALLEAELAAQLVLDGRSNGCTCSGTIRLGTQQVPAERRLHRLADGTLRQRKPGLVERLGQIALGQRPELRALHLGVLQRRGHLREALPAGDRPRPRA